MRCLLGRLNNFQGGKMNEEELKSLIMEAYLDGFKEAKYQSIIKKYRAGTLSNEDKDNLAEQYAQTFFFRGNRISKGKKLGVKNDD